MKSVAEIPTSKPLCVFPELIDGMSFVPPMIFPPKNEKVSNSHIIITNSIILILLIVPVSFNKINIKKTYVMRIL